MVEIILVAIGFLGLLAWGELLVGRWMPWHSDHPLERALTGFGLLFGAGAYLIHGLGLLGLLYRPLAWAVVGSCAAGIVVWLAKWWHGHLARDGREDQTGCQPVPLPVSDRLLIAGVCVFAIVNLAGCLTPEIRDDCLLNHLSIPAGFANAHRIEIHPFNMNMGRPQMLHMYYLLSLLFQNVFGAKLIHTMMALVGLAAMGWLAWRTCERGAFGLSLYLFYSLPVVTLYATCSYIDLGRIYFEVFPLWLILRYQNSLMRGAQGAEPQQAEAGVPIQLQETALRVARASCPCPTGWKPVVPSGSGTDAISTSFLKLNNSAFVNHNSESRLHSPVFTIENRKSKIENDKRLHGAEPQTGSQQRRRSDLILAAVIFGFGMGVHSLSSLFGWPVLTSTVFVAVLIGGGEGRWKRAILATAIFGLLSAAVFSPWVLRNWLFMGNPNPALFRTPGGADVPQHVTPDLARSLAALWELPHRLYQAIRVISIEGNCPPLLLLGAWALKFALRDRDPRRTAMLVFALLHLLLFALPLPSQDGRYILPGFTVSVVVFFHYAERLLANYRRYRRYLVGGVLALGLLNFATAKYRLQTTFGEPPWPVYSGAAVERFLTQRFGDREMVRYLNEQLPPRSKVLLETMTRPLYVWCPFMARNDMDPRILYTFLRRSKDNEALVETLRRWGLTHILVADDFPPEDLTEAQQTRLSEFRRDHLRLTHQVGNERLFEIVG